MSSYLDKTGLTYFWGKIKDYVDSHSGGSSSEPCYQSGDTLVLMQYPISGMVTTQSKQARFAIPVGKSLKNISTITVTSCTGGVRTGTGGVMNNLSSPNWLAQSGVSVSASKVGDYHITLAFSSNNTAFTNVSNNMTLCLWPENVTLTFS